MSPESSTYEICIAPSLPEHIKLSLNESGYHCQELGSAPAKSTSVLLLDDESFEPINSRQKLMQFPCIVLSRQNRSLAKFVAKNYTDIDAPWILSYSANVEDVLLLVAKACVMSELKQDLADLKNRLGMTLPQHSMVAVSPIMRELLAKAQILAKYDTTLLLTGESGTGKTSLASYIHQAGDRSDKPFISLSCASIPRDLLEAELFGYEKGAFTGATASRSGALEAADQGTLFLDEIGDLPLELQPKLLTVLQDKIVRRIGTNKTRKVDVRIITATNKDLKEMCRRKEFREDLFFRLNVIALPVPPLRERPEDVVKLATEAINRLCARFGKEASGLSKNAQEKLTAHLWPGNVRELENVIERTIILNSKKLLSAEDIELEQGFFKGEKSIPSLAGMSLEELEQRAIRDTLIFCNHDKKATASMLGISLKTLYNKIRTQ